MYSSQTRALCFRVSEITLVRGPGKGVIAIRLESQDYVEGFTLVGHENEGLTVSTSRGRDVIIKPKKYGASRASKGSKLLQRGSLSSWTRPLTRLDLMFRHTKDHDDHSSEEATSSAIESRAITPSLNEESSESSSDTTESTQNRNEEVVPTPTDTPEIQSNSSTTDSVAAPNQNSEIPTKKRKRPKIVFGGRPSNPTKRK